MNITKETEKYIAEHPGIKSCINKDLINYSALSRQICDELKIDKFDAVLIACRRYFWKHKNDPQHKNEVFSLLKNAKVMVKNKMIVAILEKPRDLEKLYIFQKKVKKKKGDFNIIEGQDVVTIITNSENASEIKEAFTSWLVKVNHNTVEIAIIFDEKIETTPGVVSYVYSLLAENNINVLEEMSCWTDLMIVIDEKDMAKAVKVLSF